MPIECRLIQLTGPEVSALRTAPQSLPAVVEGATIYSGLYRYWHAIDHLLRRSGPAGAAAAPLALGESLPTADDSTPAPRLLTPAQAASASAVYQAIEPDALAPFYDAAELDEAAVYPATWVEWEETFDPLGQVLEYYSYLQYFARDRAKAGDGMLLYFVFIHDGTDDATDDDDD